MKYEEGSVDPLLPDEESLPEGHKSGFVTVVGLPNVGKSTLLNTLLAQKIAIVTPRPQTTRARQLGILTMPTYQIVFVDTPGLIKAPRHKLDEFMLEAATETLTDADVILWVVDAGTPPGAGDRAIAAELAPLATNTPVIQALNKSDLLAPEQVIPTCEAYHALLPDARWILISAANNRGCDELLQMLVDALPSGPRYYPADQVTDTYLRDIAAEMIREQVLLQVRDEIPYGVAVQIEAFKERENDVTYISANIFVERDSHKKIVIGAKGAQLRQIGAAARRQIEQMIEGKVFLELWVKVEPKWRRSEQALRKFGYSKKN
ncbi:MAG: GTPase Era [Anaerolineales bacterium]|nr:GTPase Era [Anaerolineales bacterium]MCB8954347.1 GTPase Era [Ardenticatenales bacterium]